ncbi:MAG: tannase/feruloyl esterase family alpha/beta hydrolase [Acidobacteria bacterium]|nr:tannase/feruloyl esterase family alpha/beta hydrolase [Acidobacteriota bacterium]
MNRVPYSSRIILAALLLAGSSASAQNGSTSARDKDAACRNLVNHPALTILSAQIKEASGATPRYCYVRGLISPAIHYHVQLPLPENWNNKFLMWGDGGTDGDLDFADHRVAQGYAVANSNTGHDSASEPGAVFAYNNPQAEIDFGYRAVHVTISAAKSLVKAYYGSDPRYAYFEGCSQGGRQALMEAQRYPHDFDGMVAGAPAIYYQSSAVSRIEALKRVYGDQFAGDLAFDKDGDGKPESLTKLGLLEQAVLAKCDALDGITDRVVDDPLVCKFDPAMDLAAQMCAGDINGDACFTTRQIETIKNLYAGAADSKGKIIFKGRALGSEFGWSRHLLPFAGNQFAPSALALTADRMNYMFYGKDPGVAPPSLTDLTHIPDKTKNPPEYAWWEFNPDDWTDGKGAQVSSNLDATDANLTEFLIKRNGKLVIYHGWGDALISAEPTLDYYKEVVATTFNGDAAAARARARLFMIPGMDHCAGGSGPDNWDRLAPVVDWVEKGLAPDHLVASRRRANGSVENERKICAYPQRAVYTGPQGGENDRANWVQSNFTCR